MTLISVKAFNGLKPVVKPRLLGDNDAQVAQNARLVSGSLEPMRGSTTLKSTTLPSPKTIFRYGTSAVESNYWLEFANDTDVMRSPIPNDQWDRLYWADGTGVPRYAPNSMILTGAPYPGASYQLGLPAPNTPTVSGFATVPVYTTVTREYVITLYNPTTGKESTPSTTFSVQAVDGQKVALTNLTTANNGDAGVTKKRLYRKLSGSFRRVAELDLATTTYDDTTTDATLASAAVVSSTAASIKTPTAAPTLSAAAITTTAASARSYVYTVKDFQIITGTGENAQTDYYAESAPSTAATISVDNTQSVSVGNLSNGLGGTHFRIYRLDAGTSQYRFVAEIPVTQTSFVDAIASTVLGIPLAFDGPTANRPATAPSLSATASSANNSTMQRVYAVTFVDASGNESARGPYSSAVTVLDGVTTVTVSHNETAPAGVTKKRFYRQNASATVSESSWRLVSEVSASATSITDAASQASLGAGLAASLQGLPPTPTGTPTTNATIPAKQTPETRTYVLTYVSAYGEEGPPSDASALVSLDPTQAATLSLPSAPGGNFNVTLKRLYRSSTVGSTAQFQLVPVTWAGNSTPSYDIPVAVTQVSDAAEQAALAEVLPSEGWVAPPAGLKGLRMMANGAAVGFVGRTVYLSEPNMPHAWPHQYTIDYDIVGIATFGQTVAVLTNAFPFLLQGADPAAMTPTRLEAPQACVAKRSIIETGDGVLYASPDGLVSLGASIDVVTKNLFSRDQWQAYVPSSMDGYLYNGRVHLFYNANGTRGALVLDLSGQGAVLTTLNINAASAANAGYYDATRDLLYLAQGGAIVRMDQGAALTATWRSKIFRLPWRQSLGVGQVRAASYPVTLRVYADGALKVTKTVPDDNHFVLPGGFRALDWEFEIDAATEISEVNLATTASELKTV